MTKTHYEYVDIQANTTIWDFSHAIETGDCHDMRWINLGDSLLVKIEQGVQSVYQLHDDILFWNGYENALLCFRDSIAPIDVLNALVNRCGASSPFYFHGSYSGNHAIDLIGNYSVALSENGTLILPNDTIEDVFCITTAKNCLERVSEHKKEAPIHESNDSLIREVEIVKRWYSPIYRYPLAENVSCSYYSNQVLLQKSEVTYLCSPEEQEYSLGMLCDPETMLRNSIGIGSNPGLRAIGTKSLLSDCVTIIQNCDRINVSVNGLGNSNGEVSVLLCDVQGHVWHFQSENVDTECWRYEIITTPLPPGYYLLQIMNKNEQHVERILIKQ